MLIGQVVLVTGALQVVLCFLLGVLQLLGAAKSSLRLLCRAQRPSTEVHLAACEVAWLRTLLGDLGVHVDERVVIYCDNLSSIQLARNPVFHARTKHIEVHYHYI